MPGLVPLLIEHLTLYYILINYPFLFYDLMRCLVTSRLPSLRILNLICTDSSLKDFWSQTKEAQKAVMLLEFSSRSQKSSFKLILLYF